MDTHNSETIATIAALGRQLRDGGRFQDAVNQFDRAIGMFDNPTNLTLEARNEYTDLLYDRATALHALGLVPQAAKALNEAWELSQYSAPLALRGRYLAAHMLRSSTPSDGLSEDAQLSHSSALNILGGLSTESLAQAYAFDKEALTSQVDYTLPQSNVNEKARSGGVSPWGVIQIVGLALYLLITIARCSGS
jgi:tetratricopeptide (TPR) repeat protein